jgi:hypothetical protein
MGRKQQTRREQERRYFEALSFHATAKAADREAKLATPWSAGLDLRLDAFPVPDPPPRKKRCKRKHKKR